MKPILLSYETEPYYIKYYSVPYDTEAEYELVCSLDQQYVNDNDISEEALLFLMNMRGEWEIEGRPDISQYRTLVTTGWIQ